jgi:exodeoxyribonuclease V gamma subunit
MLHLCYSNRLEALCAPLAVRVRDAQRIDPLSPVRILVPNPAVEQFLRFEIAALNGIAAHLDVGLIRRFIGQLIEDADPKIQILDKVRLQLILYARLQSPTFIRRHKLDAIEHYLEYAQSNEERQRRAFLLSGELARLLEEYGYSRQSMLDEWTAGRTTTKGQWLETERWQRRLWRALFHDDRTLRYESSLDSEDETQPGLFRDARVSNTKYMMLMDAFEHTKSRLDPPPEIHIFGVSYVSTAFAQVFAYLAQRADFYVYAQNPCMEFWEDVQGSGLANLRADWARRNDPYDLESQDDDPFDLETYADTPALRLWARPGREYVRLLNALSHCEFAPGFVNPTSERKTLLTQVQRDVLLRAPESEIAPEMTADGSIQLLACPSLHREVEEVAEQIWTAIKRSEERDDRPLRFHEIAVFVTDSERDRYLAHIADVFAARDGIPFRILDQNLSQSSAVLSGVRQLITVLAGRFERSQVIDLLLHPNFVGPPNGERRRWREWIDQASVAWGIGPTNYEGTYLEGQRYHWSSAIERLLLGQLCTVGVDGEQKATQLNDRQVLPLASPSEARETLSVLIQSVRDLATDAQAAQRATMNLADWSAFLSRAISRYLRPESSADDAALGLCLRAIDRMRDRDIEERPLGFAVIQELLSNELQQLESKRSQHRADGVVISSLLPMRAIPFRAVFILGLGEGHFPGKEIPDPLDLRLARRHVGDVSNAERDRYIFLETLIATREQLTLSWVARNQTNGEPLETSPIIRELEYVLRPYLLPEDQAGLTSTPTMHGFEALSAERTNERFMYLQALESLWVDMPEAIRRAGGQPPITVFDDDLQDEISQIFGSISPGSTTPRLPDKTLSLRALSRFLSSPLQGSAQASFGLFHRDNSDAPSDIEPMSLSPSLEHDMLERTFWSLGVDGAEIQSAYKRVFSQTQLAGKTPAGLFGEAALNAGQHVLEAWFAHANDVGLTPLSDWKRIAIGPSAENVIVDHRIPPLVLTDAEGRDIELSGIAAHLHPQRHAMMSCVSSKQATPAHFLQCFISLATLSACGARFPDVVRVIVNTTDIESPSNFKDYSIPPRDVCREWLAQVSMDLQAGFHPYRLPIDVVIQWYRRRQRFPDAGPFLAPNARTADDRGPIKNLGPFELPATEDADQIVGRRFDLWFRAEHR